MVMPDDEIDLGGLIARFHEATFLDASLHTWMSETSTNTLFPVDWLGFPHMDGECLSCTDELDTEIDVDRLTEFDSRVMFWFQYVDVDKVCAETDRLWRELRPDRICAAHGVVIREDPRRYFEMMKEVVRRVAESGRVGVL